MPTTDYTEFLHNVKQEFITNSYELDGTFIFDIELPVTPHICPKCGETTERTSVIHLLLQYYVIAL